VVGLVIGAHVYGTLPPPMVVCVSGSLGDDPSSLLHDAMANDRQARVQRTNVRRMNFDVMGTTWARRSGAAGNVLMRESSI
jgi:hypothetical protein